MAGNKVTKVVMGIGSFTVPRGVTSISVYKVPQQKLALAGSKALKSDGTAWAWGINNYGQIGNNLATNTSSPVAVVGGSSWVAIAANATLSSFGIKTDGTAWAWGNNGSGQLGTGSIVTIAYSSPVAVVGGSSWTAIAAGYNGHVLALKTDSTVWGWGNNYSGQVGNGTILTYYSSPVQVAGGSSWIAVAVGYDFSLALKTDNTVWAWGLNANGQLGTGNTTNSSSPVAVVGGSSWVAISTGQYHCLALKTDGTAWAWGINIRGQIGNGAVVTSTSAYSSPVAVAGGSSWVAIAAGLEHSLALKADGTIWAWGSNSSGQLGTNNTTFRSSPVAVVGGSSWVAISTGQYCSFALKSDGTVWAWGYNGDGGLGAGNLTNYSSPVPIAGSNTYSNFVANMLLSTISVYPGQTISYNTIATPAYFGAVTSTNVSQFMLKYEI